MCQIILPEEYRNLLKIVDMIYYKLKFKQNLFLTRYWTPYKKNIYSAPSRLSIYVYVNCPFS